MDMGNKELKNQELQKIIKSFQEKHRKYQQTMMSLYKSYEDPFIRSYIPIKWSSNGIEIKSYSTSSKLYDPIEVVNAFLYFIDLNGIDKVETSSFEYTLYIELYYKDDNSLSIVETKLKKGVKEFENFTGYKVKLEIAQGEVKNTVKDRKPRKPQYTIEVVLGYRIFINESEENNENKELKSNSQLVDDMIVKKINGEK